jgi:5-formyltetrahydrofolate cyclo-ligase
VRAVTVGVGFDEQLVDDLPTEPHDIVLHHVVTA